MYLPQFVLAGLLLVAGAQQAVAVPAPTTDDISTAASASCAGKDVLVRKEWRSLPKPERLDYINAVKCLMKKPSKNGGVYAGAKSRYDDFLALHIVETDLIHFNGPFLAWHRWFLHLFEQELRNTCGYKGAQPYWDFSKDNTINGFSKSPLFDVTHGLGGNGPYVADVSDPITFPVTTPTIIPNRTGGGCLDNGPFSGLVVNMGLGLSTDYTPHCLRRDFSPVLVSQALSNSNLKAALDAKNYFDFSIKIQGTSFEVSGLTLHAGMHLGIGGQVGDAADMYSSPGDPLFWFIHGALDKIWDQWQRANWSVRKSEIAGPDTNFAYPFNFFGDVPYKNITLDFPLQYPYFGKNLTVRDVMDTKNAALCYTYA
ncbi:uncharacterized protein JN550_010012 [Neoarthrinium moseri]|uniref:uncharacterized protein n=1 Tax=Neoarthrinium moseri TaxID=1658444 RepID=UPI001FDE7BF8|nr:uncharacterized protein JN550_010012 [Neoarthrinium moseri]KAI1862675.1 hypothetical protein JN550_010012 [Neoarthrinium moseri]